jgi:hypothetical protein
MAGAITWPVEMLATAGSNMVDGWRRICVGTGEIGMWERGGHIVHRA